MQHGLKEEIIANYAPDYLFMNATRGTLAMMNQTKYKTLYVPVARFSPNNDSTISGNPDKYPTQWVQDYILYQKIQPAN